VPYQDETQIQKNVLSQCTSLGSNFSDFISASLIKNGYSVVKVDPLDITSDIVLDVKITNLMSAGNAFLGHQKSVTAVAKVYKNGQAGPTEVFTRHTMGGFGAGFKGSCTVLDRDTTALANDIAQWYKKQS
jgi:hypothetical protein